MLYWVRISFTSVEINGSTPDKNTNSIYSLKCISVDETMAPLDPASKLQVMAKLKSFCNSSVVLIIYHTDVGRSTTLSFSSGTQEESEEDDGEECVPSNSFFDHNLHVVDKHLITRSMC